METSVAGNPSAPLPGLTRVVLGVTGGIAAYKAAELTRLFVKAGIAVDVVMTEAATRFVTPMTFQALTGRPVATDLWHSGASNAMDHIDLTRGADLAVVAPASADFIAKLAHGIADDLLSALCLARECPLAVAPAMNVQMWFNAATQRNVAQLRADGIALLREAPRRGLGDLDVRRVALRDRAGPARREQRLQRLEQRLSELGVVLA